VSLLEEMEQDILLMEKGDAQGLKRYQIREHAQGPAGGHGCARGYPALPRKRGPELIAARPTHEQRKLYLDIRDVLYEYYSLRAEGDQAAAL